MGNLIIEKVKYSGDKYIYESPILTNGINLIVGDNGSGKSTLAIELGKVLFQKGFFPIVLDGDNIRTGLCNNLSFTEEDRAENIRRVSEIRVGYK